MSTVENTYAPQNDYDEKVDKFTVSNPTKKSGHVIYTVTGVDDVGEFEIVRRFRDFHALYECFKMRWPGIYIPAIPDKKLVGGKDEQYVEERMRLLDYFMKDVAKYDYLTSSEEFKLFCRGHGEIEKLLKSLPRQRPSAILEKYREHFTCNESIPKAEIKGYKQVCYEFVEFLKKMMPIMDAQKQRLKKTMQTRQERDNKTKDLY